MKKFFIQLVTFLCLFLGIWFLLSRIHYTETLDVKKFSQASEEKLGKLIMESLQKENGTVTSDSIARIVETIKGRICHSNQIDSGTIQIHLFHNKEINAFAMPGNHMVIYTGLIDLCKSPEELSAVMAHEMAHIENKHVVKKLSKEVGMSLLVTLTGGGNNSGIMREVTKILTSTAFDRTMEREADTMAVTYLSRANIDPECFANILFRLSRKVPGTPDHLEWISTHPDSKERTSKILELRKMKKFKVVPLLNDSIWAFVKKEIKKEEED